MAMNREAAVAGLFYPQDPDTLARDIRMRLDTAAPAVTIRTPPKALLVPHAGYRYSGAVAASAYACLRPWHRQYRRVVLLGPAHRIAVTGLALPEAHRFSTPLGQLDVDQQAITRLLASPTVVVNAAAHAHEHSLEVQLPFLQQLLGEFSLVPLAVGDASAEQVAEVVQTLWGGKETLIVVSSDLSHYLPYAVALRIDRQTCEKIARLDTLDSHEQACGATPINGLLLAARRHGLQAQLLDLRNSGDTAGDRDRVVGYAAFAFTEAPPRAA